MNKNRIAPEVKMMNGHRSSLLASLLLPSVLCLGCGGPAPLTVDMPLHLEEHLDVATIVGSEVPEDVPTAVEWRFDEPQPNWKPAYGYEFSQKLVTLVRTGDALRVVIEEEHVDSDGDLCGYVYTDLPDWQLQDWVYVAIRARVQPGMESVRLAFNFTEPARAGVWQVFGSSSPMISDGTVQTYLLSADPGRGDFDGPWRQLLLQFCAFQPSTIDLLSVSVIPKEATYAAAPAGVQTEVHNRVYRRTLYSHAPGRLEYRVRVPEAGRLDIGLGVLRDDAPVTFRVTARPEGSDAQTLLAETYADPDHWAQRSVDLSHLAGQTVTLVLEADAERAGSVALWAAPTISGARTTDKPNVVFYIIDSGGADYMSVYGYNRRTTPNLERLAAEGALFERAYSNSRYTKVSTPSFMTSLQNSVLGGFKSNSDPLPDQAVTMAQHLHRAGYQTGVFTSSAQAGTSSSLDREVDALRQSRGETFTASSRELNEDFWRWREAYPGEPYWAHFQTGDLVYHPQPDPVAPFAGLFTSPELRETYYEWDRQLQAVWREEGGIGPGSWQRGAYSATFEKTGISRLAYFNARRGLYDENLANTDYQLGRLVERLKAEGEWEHTLLIVAADHGSHSQQGLGLLDSLPPDWGPLLRSYSTRVPLIVVWPERIAPGQRFSHPVSMIDLLPTILDLVGLPMPEVMQGQSLAPLLLGEEGWQPRPVILDEFDVDPETGELRGQIEVIDGRWGASLEINPWPERPPERQRPVPLLLYDLWNDPQCLNSLHEERPDLVEKYTEFLEAQWEAHQSLAQRFTRSSDVALTPEQLQTLRTLGYIQ
ncbi:MAG: sulfatase [Gemmatimonadetes bacterium]|nr:sulfatase [Gemmatimonadota bacterium]